MCVYIYTIYIYVYNSYLQAVADSQRHASQIVAGAEMPRGGGA